MLLFPLEHSAEYESLHPEFAAVLAFLKQHQNEKLETGKHDVPGTRSFVIVSQDLGRGKSDSPLEVHREYIDIQYVVEGKELIGWSPLDACKQPTSEFDPSRDIGFFQDLPQSWLVVRPGQCAVFYPEDAHAPLAASGPVRKIVAKIPRQPGQEVTTSAT